MKPQFTALLLSPLLTVPAIANDYLELSLYPDCRQLTPAEVDPRDWFPQASRKERERLRQNSRQHYADARAMAERLLSDPQDEAAFYLFRWFNFYLHKILCLSLYVVFISYIIISLYLHLSNT